LVDHMRDSADVTFETMEAYARRWREANPVAQWKDANPLRTSVLRARLLSSGRHCNAASVK